MSTNKKRPKRPKDFQSPKAVERAQVWHDSEYLNKVGTRIRQKRADVPRKYQPMFDRAMAGKASPRDVLHLNCLECVGWVRGELERCTNYACPSHQYRRCLRKKKK